MALRVLVVEDDAPSLDLIREVLQSLEAEVHALADSREAAQRIQSERFDGIFLDYHMPELDGLEVASLIRTSSWNKLTPIVFVTGAEAQNLMKNAFASGATFFLQKPIDRRKLAQLFRTIRGTFLERQRRFKRVPLRLPVTCTADGQTFEATSVDLSRGGMLVQASRLLSPGMALRVSFRLPDSKWTISAAGVVANVMKNEAGIRFTTLPPADQARLDSGLDGLE